MEGDSIQEVLDTERARVEAIDAGWDVFEQFRNSGALTKILVKAREEAIDALQRLVEADPFKPEVIRDLQWQVTRYDALCQWIETIVESAQAATEDLTAEQAAAIEQMLRGEDSEPKDA